ncbi:MAG: radical SAM protein [Planctomycetaceae bacterium]|jgi:predicted O-linked N-acetylglucosamine transferase (SPINDLY family)|nr:radical SAM protein [Planctomycetaceae bacterium]
MSENITTSNQAKTPYVENSIQQGKKDCQQNAHFSTHEESPLLQKGIAYHAQGDFISAISSYQQFLETSPNSIDTWYRLSSAALSQKNYPLAHDSIHHAFELCQGKPPHPAWFVTYGYILCGLNRLNDAIIAFENSVRLNISQADGWWGLVTALYALNRPPQQIENALTQLFSVAPKHYDAILLYAELCQKQRRYLESIELFKKALELLPENTFLHERIIHAFASGGKHQEALDYYREHVEHESDTTEFHHTLGTIYGETGDIEKSKQHFQRSSQISGNHIFRWKHLGYCPVYFDNATQIDEYWTQLHHDLDEAIAESPVYDWRRLPYDGFTPSFHLPHHNRCCKEIKEKFATLFEKSFFFKRPPLRYSQRSDGKIRVGFLVTAGHEGGFCRMMRGIMQGLNPDRFEVFLFYNKDFAHWFRHLTGANIRHVPYYWDFEQAVQKIRETLCDVLYHWKVAADTWSMFFPMTYLAPIQCTSWGTHGTGGVSHVDYYLTWNAAEILNAQNHYTEKLHRMSLPPNIEYREERPQNVRREKLGLPSQHALYFCPHRLSKYHPDYDFYLKDILTADTDGYILLLFGDSTQISEKIKERMKRNIGNDLFKRMIFIPRLGVKSYYEYLSASTVVLDSPIYAGELTCYDAFSVGVPSVTRTGDLLIQRYTTAHYQDLKINAPIAANREEYVEYATWIGTDEEYRNELTSQIREKYPLMLEKEGVVAEYERFIEEAVQTYEHKENVSAIAVVPRKQRSEEVKKTAVPIGDLEINLTYGCNQKCKYCSHFCGYNTGIESVENILAWYKTWSIKVIPKNLRLIGGEPLLHPELEFLIRETDRVWSKTRVNLVTNGLLLNKISDKIIQAIIETNAFVFVSCHYNAPEYLREFHKGIDRLIRSGVSHAVYTSYRDWRKVYHIDSCGKILPFQSVPEKAWQNCIVKNACPSLMNNTVFKCQYLAHVVRNRKSGLLGDEWRRADDYQPLPPTASSEEILSHLNSEWIPECSLCAERYEYASLAEKRELQEKG